MLEDKFSANIQSAAGKWLKGSDLGHSVSDAVRRMTGSERSDPFKTFQQNMASWCSLVGKLEQLLDGAKPTTMSEVYSHLYEELELRLDETARVGYGFVLRRSSECSRCTDCPEIAPK
jgi:hypothetical protein